MSSLLEEVTHLPSLHQRKVGSLLGAAVADAAARPLHWVYDTEELQRAIRRTHGGRGAGVGRHW